MFTQATKESAKLRVAIFGPSGSGKTFSSLSIATGIGEPIAVIDTERRTARKYSDRFNFIVAELTDRTLAGYTKAIKAAEQARVGTLIIDSMSHGWDELLSEIDRLAANKYSGNSMRAWGEGTPKQRAFIDTLLNFPGHIIATMRADTDWAIDRDNNGRVKVTKLGLKPRQGKGIEYEFDLLMELSADHVASITKDRTGKYQDQTIDKPGEDFGRELAAWLATDVPRKDTATPPAADREVVVTLKSLVEKHKIPDTTLMEWNLKFGGRTLAEITDDNLNKIIAAVRKKYEDPNQAA